MRDKVGDGVSNIFKEDKSKTKCEMFDIKGSLTNDPDDACAQQFSTGTSLIHKVRANKHNRLYDPAGNANNPNELDAFNSGPKFKFKEVNPKVFENYLSFLQTKEISRLHIAERNL